MLKAYRCGKREDLAVQIFFYSYHFYYGTVLTISKYYLLRSYYHFHRQDLREQLLVLVPVRVRCELLARLDVTQRAAPVGSKQS